MKLRRLDSRDAGFDVQLATLTRYDAAQDEAVDATVRSVIADVRARGDQALLEYTWRFDASEAASVAALEVGRADLEQALAGLPAASAAALREAAQRIRAYHEHQLAKSWQFQETD